MKEAVMALLTVIVLITIVTGAKAETVRMIENTDYCMENCYTIYEVCNGKEEMKENTDFTIYTKTDKGIEFIKPEGKIREIKSKTEKSKEGCTTINVTGKKDPFESIDNILCTREKCYEEYAWWNAYWKSCTNININATDGIARDKELAYRINISNITFTQPYEARLVNAECGSGGTEQVYTLGEYGNGWVEMSFFYTGGNTTWAVYHNATSAINPGYSIEFNDFLLYPWNYTWTNNGSYQCNGFEWTDGQLVSKGNYILKTNGTAGDHNCAYWKYTDSNQSDWNTYIMLFKEINGTPAGYGIEDFNDGTVNFEEWIGGWEAYNTTMQAKTVTIATGNWSRYKIMINGPTGTNEYTQFNYAGACNDCNAYMNPIEVTSGNNEQLGEGGCTVVLTFDTTANGTAVNSETGYNATINGTSFYENCINPGNGTMTMAVGDYNMIQTNLSTDGSGYIKSVHVLTGPDWYNDKISVTNGYEAVEGALVEVEVFRSSIPYIVQSLYTNKNGEVMIPTEYWDLHRITVTKTGYTTRTIEKRPLPGVSETWYIEIPKTAANTTRNATITMTSNCTSLIVRSNKVCLIEMEATSITGNLTIETRINETGNWVQTVTTNSIYNSIEITPGTANQVVEIRGWVNGNLEKAMRYEYKAYTIEPTVPDLTGADNEDKAMMIMIIMVIAAGMAAIIDKVINGSAIYAFGLIMAAAGASLA